MRLIFQKFDPIFQQTFTHAFQSYIKGQWSESKQMLQEGLKLKPEDGPTLSLLSVMQETNFKAPADWKGYRVLTEK